jgi:hypothetical protein
MRENPWHLRHPTTEHYQWFKNLVTLHELTQNWLNELQPDRAPDLFTRGLSPEITENLWMLRAISEDNMENLLDDTLPEDLLIRLEHTIWAVQATALVNLQGKTAAQNRPSSEDSLLEQISWRLGVAAVESRWQALAANGPQDLRDILLAMNDTPFSGYPTGNGFLVRRAITTEIQVELRCCPHRLHYYEVKSVADRLCRLHAQWIRGFAHALNKEVNIEHVVQSPRCIQRWYFT